MAFTNTPSEGVPFYRGIAPEVPKPDNTAAEIISRGTATGVNAFVQMALAKERNALAQQEMLQRADLHARNLEFQREELDSRHGLAVSAQGLQQQGLNNQLWEATQRIDLASSQQDLARDSMEVRKWFDEQDLGIKQAQQQGIIDNRDAMTKYYNTQSDLTSMGITSMVNTAVQSQEYKLKAGQTANELNLEGDPGPNPALYGKNAIGYEKLYGSSLDPMIQKKVKEYMAKAEASKAKLQDEAGNSVEYPWIQIVRDIDKNGFNSPFIPMLEESGYMEQVRGMFTTESGEKVKSKEHKPVGEFKRFLEGSKQGTPFKEIEKFQSVQDPYAQSAEAVMNTPVPGRKGATVGDVYNRVTTTRSGNVKQNLPIPDVSPVQEEADYVRAQNDADPANAAVRNARFLAAHPGMGHMIQ